jgi:hypothetical protein
VAKLAMNQIILMSPLSCANSSTFPLSPNNRIAPTSTLRLSLWMWLTMASAMTQGSIGCASLCTSTVSYEVSPLLARSSVACVARVTHTRRTGPQGEPPGSATRPSPSAAIVEQLILDALPLWNLSYADFDSISCFHCIVKFCYLSEPPEPC